MTEKIGFEIAYRIMSQVNFLKNPLPWWEGAGGGGEGITVWLAFGAPLPDRALPICGPRPVPPLVWRTLS
jgi:hypothetical protein